MSIVKSAPQITYFSFQKQMIHKGHAPFPEEGCFLEASTERKADESDPSLPGIDKYRLWQRRGGDAGAV